MEKKKVKPVVESNVAPVEVTPEMSPRRSNAPAPVKEHVQEHVPVSDTQAVKQDLSPKRLDGEAAAAQVGPGPAAVPPRAQTPAPDPSIFDGKGVIWLHGYIRQHSLSLDLLDIVDAAELRRRLVSIGEK